MGRKRFKYNITFYKYLTTQRINESSPIGDLARDIKADKEWPKKGYNANSYIAMSGYLFYKKKACKEANEALLQAYHDWENVAYLVEPIEEGKDE